MSYKKTTTHSDTYRHKLDYQDIKYMQQKKLKELSVLIAQEVNKKINIDEDSKEFRNLMLEKKTKTIRIYKEINVMLVKHCENSILTPSQFASRAIALEILRDREKFNNP